MNEDRINRPFDPNMCPIGIGYKGDIRAIHIICGDLKESVSEVRKSVNEIKFCILGDGRAGLTTKVDRNTQGLRRLWWFVGSGLFILIVMVLRLLLMEGGA